MKEHLERFRTVSRKVMIKYLATLASFLVASILAAIVSGLFLGDGNYAFILYVCILAISIFSSAMIIVVAVKELVTVEMVMALYELMKTTQPPSVKVEEVSEAPPLQQAAPTARRMVAPPSLRAAVEGATPVKQAEVRQPSRSEKRCPYCGRVLPFGDIHTICPYCGKRLR